MFYASSLKFSHKPFIYINIYLELMINFIINDKFGHICKKPQISQITI